MPNNFDQIRESTKAMLYQSVIFAKILKDFADSIHKQAGIYREAKGIMSFISNACASFTSRVRAGLSTEEGKKQFDAEWQRDYLSWAAIFESLISMNDLQIAAVEQFCQGILNGDVVITQSTQPGCPNCKAHNGQQSIGADNWQCSTCKNYYTLRAD